MESDEGRPDEERVAAKLRQRLEVEIPAEPRTQISSIAALTIESMAIASEA